MERSQSAHLIDRETVLAQFPQEPHQCVYLNSGSCGRKPKSVLNALSSGWHGLNNNPTYSTFLDTSPFEAARAAVGELIGVSPKNILLTQSTTDGLHLVMSSLLLKPGDELITTDQEHGSLRTIARHLEETRGIKVSIFPCDPYSGSEALCLGILAMVSEKTKLVAVSEVQCFTGWRPDLTMLTDSLDVLDVPFLVDGAHVPGHVPSRADKFPFWVGSGHKWLGGPNGTGFLRVIPKMVPILEPVWLGNQYYQRLDEGNDNLLRFESRGTQDVVRLAGLEAAARLALRLGVKTIAIHQLNLKEYLRSRLARTFNPRFRTPLFDDGQETSMLAFHFEPDRLQTTDLRQYLWDKHQIWTQPDFISATPGHGLRISCHYANTTDDIDKLIGALEQVVTKA